MERLTDNEVTHFKFGLEQFCAGNKMSDSSLIQSVRYRLLSQRGIECHHYNKYQADVKCSRALST